VKNKHGVTKMRSKTVLPLGGSNQQKKQKKMAELGWLAVIGTPGS